jgi:glycosyltransferase involved in cell wall biosynthesis
MINIPFCKSISVLVFSFKTIASWAIRSRKETRVVYCDALNLALSISALIICRLSGIKIIGIVTDIPGMIVSGRFQANTLESKFHDMLRLKIMSGYDGYVFLTPQMNDLINIRQKPYIIMEGMVDIEAKNPDSRPDFERSDRILIYAGGICEEYGVRKLINAFMLIDRSDIQLHIYGGGKMELEMAQLSDQDHRIKYMGIVSNDMVVKALREATLLINPRPSISEFTKYSFPSKNMEYMASGTPLVTTPLPGMPKEYNRFVYLFNDESVEGISSTLRTLLSKSSDELYKFGLRAKQFVINQKNNLIQAQRILNLSESISEAKPVNSD